MQRVTRGMRGRGLLSDTALTNEQLQTVAPSIFASDPHCSRSVKYAFIPTIKVLEGLRREGFEPFMVAQSKSRIPGKAEFTKHMIRLRKRGLEGDNESPEVILINSHDGTSSYQILTGCFRFVCQNGMVTGDVMQDIRIPHKGDVIGDVIDAAYTVVDNIEPMAASIGDMKSTILLPREKQIFAGAALALKEEVAESSIKSDQLLLPRRYVDNKDDLWTTFNVIQENMMKGGIRGIAKTGRKTRTRGITSIDKNVKLNQALWVLADEMARLKGI